MDFTLIIIFIIIFPFPQSTSSQFAWSPTRTCFRKSRTCSSLSPPVGVAAPLDRRAAPSSPFKWTVWTAACAGKDTWWIALEIRSVWATRPVRRAAVTPADPWGTWCEWRVKWRSFKSASLATATRSAWVPVSLRMWCRTLTGLKWL